MEVEEVGEPTASDTPVTEEDEKSMEQETLTPLDIHCNCYATARYYRPDMPQMATVMATVTATPRVGSIAYFDYHGLQHFAFVTAVTDTTVSLLEGNYKHCELTTRTVERTDPALVGYWN